MHIMVVGAFIVAAAMLVADEHEIDVGGVHFVHAPEAAHTAANTARQAVILRDVKPDIVFMERSSKAWLEALNDFPPRAKPAYRVLWWRLREALASLRYPWLATEGDVIDALKSEWASDHQVYIFGFDGPPDLTGTADNRPGIANTVWNLLRESFMIERLRHPGVEAYGKQCNVSEVGEVPRPDQ